MSSTPPRPCGSGWPTEGSPTETSTPPRPSSPGAWPPSRRWRCGGRGGRSTRRGTAAPRRASGWPSKGRSAASSPMTSRKPARRWSKAGALGGGGASGQRMRLANAAHTSRPWRIHELTADFQLEDVWALPTPGGPDDFPRLVQLMSSGAPSQGSSRAARTLWAIRWKVGKLLGWDGPDAGVGSRVPTLRDRLPVDLREGPSGPDFDALPFTSLYLLDDEFAAEIANRTMHGVMHIGRVPDQTGGFRVQMAVLVKPNGLFGTAYMAAIRPFRHLIVYPAMMRGWERTWRAQRATN